MRDDLIRFALISILAISFGLLVGQVWLCLTISLVLFVAWHYQALRKIHDFIRSDKADELPDSAGILNEMIREIDFMRNSNHRQQEKLADYIKRFQKAAKALPDAIVILDQNKAIEWANKKARGYLGVRWPQDDRQRISNLIRNPALNEYILKIESGKKIKPGIVMPSPVDDKINLEIRIKSYGDSYSLLIARDITEIQRINKMRKDFIANASHELRTPLTVITGYLESFQGDDDCPESWRKQVKQMRNQTDRMRRLIEDLLKISSLESGDDVDTDEIVPVADMLNGICEEARAYSGELSHIFYVEVDFDYRLKGNQRDLYSAFSNIVFNAVQYTPMNGVIRVRWYVDEKGGHMEVTDTGDGVSPEHIPRLTERFYRVDAGRSREKGGTGLGLSIVKHVLAKHESKLDIWSEPGKGTTFICHFPKKRILQPQNTKQVSLTA